MVPTPSKSGKKTLKKPLLEGFVIKVGPPKLTRFEKARIVGARSLQLAMGAPAFVTIEKSLRDPITIASAELEEGGLRGGGARALLHEPRVLRSGRIGETVLSAVPGLDRLVPGRILGLEETKWRSRGTLQIGSCEEEGWAIHELVRWPL